MMRRVLAIVTVLAACAVNGAEEAAPGVPNSVVVSDEKRMGCPVTIPPVPGFSPPEPYPATYPHEGGVWFGTADLWTELSPDGSYGPRKSVWWSVNFPGGMVEETPEVWVTWTRIDVDPPVVLDNGGKATNAHTAEVGWFMIAGIDPGGADGPLPGCWRVEATYKGAILSYVYWVS